MTRLTCNGKNDIMQICDIQLFDASRQKVTPDSYVMWMIVFWLVASCRCDFWPFFPMFFFCDDKVRGNKGVQQLSQGLCMASLTSQCFLRVAHHPSGVPSGND